MSMKQKQLARIVAAAILGAAALSASAQNVAIVNGKAVPMARVNALKTRSKPAASPLCPRWKR